MAGEYQISTKRSIETFQARDALPELMLRQHGALVEHRMSDAYVAGVD